MRRNGASPDREPDTCWMATPGDDITHVTHKEYDMKIDRKGSAVWSGGLKDGKGAISTQSGALKSYRLGFGSRFEGVAGTNPEELIGAAHAGCFTMALSLMLGDAGFKADEMNTEAKVTLEQQP